MQRRKRPGMLRRPAARYMRCCSLGSMTKESPLTCGTVVAPGLIPEPVRSFEQRFWISTNHENETFFSLASFGSSASRGAAAHSSGWQGRWAPLGSREVEWAREARTIGG